MDHPYLSQEIPTHSSVTFALRSFALDPSVLPATYPYYQHGTSSTSSNTPQALIPFYDLRGVGRPSDFPSILENTSPGDIYIDVVGPCLYLREEAKFQPWPNPNLERDVNRHGRALSHPRIPGLYLVCELEGIAWRRKPDVMEWRNRMFDWGLTSRVDVLEALLERSGEVLPVPEISVLGKRVREDVVTIDDDEERIQKWRAAIEDPQDDDEAEPPQGVIHGVSDKVASEMLMSYFKLYHTDDSSATTATSPEKPSKCRRIVVEPLAVAAATVPSPENPSAKKSVAPTATARGSHASKRGRIAVSSTEKVSKKRKVLPKGGPATGTRAKIAESAGPATRTRARLSLP